ncbi:E3 ubiquitin-protein ligase RNF182-like isoform X2 [Hemicordylus capensis]|nr:E3 ubiquitin-protein ligase RNF182-like isoform X2 [Hemicordylus capensis]
MSPTKGRAGGSQQPLGFMAHEAECQICYEPFDAHSRRPKLLSCQHHVCARCLCRMVDAAGEESSGHLSCPFCRQETAVPGKGGVGQLPDDGRLLALLSCQERSWRPGGGGAAPPSPEVFLCPSILEPFGEGLHSSSSDCLVITLLEVPEDLGPPHSLGLWDVLRLQRPPSLASLPCHGPLAPCPPCSRWQAVPRFLLGVLCLVYLSSLPFGIYLLLVEHLNLGIILVSLVPSTLISCLCYSLCQCLCHELFDFPS